MTNTEIEESDRIYFRDVEPKLRESHFQSRYDKLRKEGFTFGVNVENNLAHTDYKRRKLNELIRTNFTEDTSPVFIGIKYRELYLKGKNPDKK